MTGGIAAVGQYELFAPAVLFIDQHGPFQVDRHAYRIPSWNGNDYKEREVHRVVDVELMEIRVLYLDVVVGQHSERLHDQEGEIRLSDRL